MSDDRIREAIPIPPSKIIFENETTGPDEKRGSDHTFNPLVLILIIFGLLVLSMICMALTLNIGSATFRNDQSIPTIESVISVSRKSPTPKVRISPTETATISLGNIVEKDPTPVSGDTSEDISDPVDFIYRYYELVSMGEYQIAWNMLTQEFKDSHNSTGYGPYQEWWNSVKEVKILSITVNSISPDRSHITAELSYFFTNGRVDTYDKMDFYLILDEVSGDWVMNDARLISGAR